MALERFEFRFKVLLTGTPIQNHLAELFALLHFLDPVKFADPKAFPMESSDLETEEAVRGPCLPPCLCCSWFAFG